MNHRVANVHASPPPNKTVVVTIATANGTPGDAHLLTRPIPANASAPTAMIETYGTSLNSMYQPKLGFCGPGACDKKYGVATAKSKQATAIAVSTRTTPTARR